MCSGESPRYFPAGSAGRFVTTGPPILFLARLRKTAATLRPKRERRNLVMRHRLLLAALLFALGTIPARGHGGRFRRPAAPVEVRYYLSAPAVWVPVVQPFALPVFAAPVSMPAVVNIPLA